MKIYNLKTDSNGQPPANFNHRQRAERVFDEMLGICKGIIADGKIIEQEVLFLKSWIDANPESVSSFPGRELSNRLLRIVADGVVSEEEQSELHEFLKSFTGQTDEIPTAEQKPATVFFDDPEPQIVIAGNGFSFTGKFVSGTRDWCADQVVVRGGKFHKKPISETSFLVVGTGGSRDWVHSTFGRKMESAFEYREKYGTKIVSEEHWVKFL